VSANDIFDYRTWRPTEAPDCLSIVDTGLVHSRQRSEPKIILSCDTAQDGESRYKESDTLIALGTQSGKVYFFSSLGLLVHEISVEAQIVALEWVGDMTAPSVSPGRIASPTPSVPETTIDIEQPVLDLILDQYKSEANEATGTVQRRSLRKRSSAISSPIPLGRTQDLFSGASESEPLESAPCKPTETLNVRERLQETVTRPRKSYHPRPRIVTETFKVPNPSITKTTPSRPKYLSSPVVMTTAGARQWSQMHTALDSPLILSTLGFTGNLCSSGGGDNERNEARTEECDLGPTIPMNRSASSKRLHRFPSEKPCSKADDRRTSQTCSVTPSPSTTMPPRSAYIRRIPNKGKERACRQRPGFIYRSQVRRYSKEQPTAEEKVQCMGRYLRYGHDDNDSSEDVEERAKPRRKYRSRDILKEENEMLWNEILALREEFRLLREAMLASRS
jgi:hypothetical protein